MAFTQSNRLIRINTPLEADSIFVESFEGREEISSLFTYKVKAFSEDQPIEFEKIVGQPIVMSVPVSSDEERHFHGHIKSFDRLDSRTGIFRYELEVVPWLWFLTLTSDCRIFQDRTVVEIAEEVFSDFGFSDYELRLNKSYEPREYCVQYRETYYNFIARLLEEEGIAYYFVHQESRHKLILADSRDSHERCPVIDTLRYHREEMVESEDAISEWHEGANLRPGRMALSDFNFETPETDLDVQIDTVNPMPSTGDLEMYDYPGGYMETSQGDRYVKQLMEAEESKWVRARGTANCVSLATGHLFSLTGHYIDETNKTHMLLSTRHQATNNFDVGDAHGSTYANEFICLDAEVPFRPAQVTPRPIVYGPQTAIVVGPKGEEIYVDKYGRVKVQFHWDRRGQLDEKSSCWIRVTQGWAGKRWGEMTLPRIGMEVIVSFLEGDPDHPMVTGCVNNAENMPPYSLPDERTKTATKTYSSPGGGGFNEIRFEDKKDKEQIFVHAQRNQDTRVKKDSLEWIGKNRHLIVGENQVEHVKGDKHLSVKGDQNEKVDGIVSLEAGQSAHTKTGMDYAVKAGMNIAIEAGMSITLKVGGNFINIGPAGIFMNGTMVLINSGGAAGPLSASPESPMEPTEADDGTPGEAAALPTVKPLPTLSADRGSVRQIEALKESAKAGTPFCEQCYG